MFDRVVEEKYNGTVKYRYVYNGEGDLATAKGNGKSISYHYDMDGVRDSKTVDGVKHEYITQGGNVTLERWNDGEEKSLEFIYDNGGAPYSVIYSRGNEVDTYYYILNQQGDVIRIVDTSGKTVSEYTYNGWGEILNVSNAKDSEIGTINPIRYRGYYYDSELNMYYLQSRYYDPVMKRMICADDESLTADATLNNNNLFAYCDNNPVNRADVEGDIWNVVAGAVCGAACNTGLQIFGNIVSGEHWSSGVASAAVSGAITGAVSAVPGVGTVADAVINGAVGAGVEAYSQYHTYAEKKRRGQKQNTRLEIAASIGHAAVTSALPSFVGTRHKGNLKATAKAAKSVKTAARILKKSVSRKNLKGAKKATKLIMKSNNRSTWKGAAASGFSSFVKNVFCYGQSGKCSYLLYDDRNSLMVCLYLIGCCDFFSFQNKFSGIFLIDTSQTGSQCRFTGTIFTDYDCNYRMTIFLKCQSEEKSCQRKCNDFVFGNIYTHIFCNHFITSDCICIDSDLCIFQDKCTEEICDQCQDQIDRIITECSIFCRKDYILSVCGIYAQGFVDQRKCTGYDQR